MTRKLDRTFSCGVEFTLAIVGGKWKPVILAHLKQGARRYGELRACIPKLSDKMLTQRLGELEKAGLVRRRKQGGRGAPSIYELTARAQSLGPALQAMNDWGTRVAREYGARVGPGSGTADKAAPAP